MYYVVGMSWVVETREKLPLIGYERTKERKREKEKNAKTSIKPKNLHRTTFCA